MGRDVTGLATDTIQENFNPLSPYGERPKPSITAQPSAYISTHSPRMGRDKYIKS